jgi:hypothetical protein
MLEQILQKMALQINKGIRQLHDRNKMPYATQFGHRGTTKRLNVHLLLNSYQLPGNPNVRTDLDIFFI